jgi:UDP-N-acetyl-D-glucosamine dehydrogenase
VADTRESPVYKIVPLLQKAGARVLYNDPYVAELTVKDCRPQRMESTALSERLLSAVDCVVMLTDHSCFDCESILRASQVIIDTRNAFRSVNGHPGKVVKL